MLRQRAQVGAGLKNTLRIDPRVVLASQVLEMTQFELEQAIQTELVENPAMERIDEYDECISQEDILKRVAPAELKPGGESRELQRSLPQDAGTEPDWIDLAVSVDSLCDHLIAQLKFKLPRELMTVGEYLVGSVNDRGYLTCTVEEAALDCDCSLEDAEQAITALQSCEPAGVGAHNLQECLYLQLREAEGAAEKLARSMLKKQWDDLVARNSRAIMRAYNAPADLVQEAFDVILSLNPFPGESFKPASSNRVEPSVQALPDVVITLEEIGWLIEVPGPSPINLRVNAGYASQYAECRKRPGTDPEKRHVFEFVDRAHRFLDVICQRRQQLARIGKYMVEHQAGFVKTGEYRFLMPLTRSQMAKDLGVHESTISRATAGKFIQLATHDVVPFDVFFKPALKVQKMIEEILSTENPDSPLSDERIATMLAKKGVVVARRTVNKYRDRSKLLSSRMRKSA